MPEQVYPIDFGALTTPGTYTIEIAGKTPATSPPFEVAAAAQLYEAPLANALSFYENERDGPEYIPSALRSAPAHLNDEHAMTYATPKANAEGEFKGELPALGETIDASGGWWDAGDYLKFVQTTSYTVALQLAGVRDFPGQMGAAAGSSDFTEEARFGVEWLLKMWNDNTRTLYYQVGIGSGNGEAAGDHDIWRLPQADDSYGGSSPQFRYIRERPVFRAGPPGAPVSPNLAGRDAAAFALCFQVFAATRPELATRCLRSGEHIFELADTDPQGNLLTALPYGFYPETEWRDDLELGASELSIALAGADGLPAGLPHTEAGYYLEQAAHWAGAYISRSGQEGEGLNLYDVSGLGDYELVRAIREQGDPAGLEVGEAGLIADLPPRGGDPPRAPRGLRARRRRRGRLQVRPARAAPGRLRAACRAAPSPRPRPRRHRGRARRAGRGSRRGARCRRRARRRRVGRRRLRARSRPHRAGRRRREVPPQRLRR